MKEWRDEQRDVDPIGDCSLFHKQEVYVCTAGDRMKDKTLVHSLGESTKQISSRAGLLKKNGYRATGKL